MHTTKKDQLLRLLTHFEASIVQIRFHPLHKPVSVCKEALRPILIPDHFAVVVSRNPPILLHAQHSCPFCLNMPWQHENLTKQSAQRAM